ncbi:MAG: SDR family NAD(P)-dependent oxidoreductase [Dehalococcoidia bacterium]|nr:SDR family NAD(P)-dependent oxidoreductase [Dehalococcoidia bacterium]
MALPLEGKVAIVTGSSRGIGKGIAVCLAEAGADIAVCARSDDAAANPLGSINKTAAEIQALGRKAIAVKLDVTNDDQCRAAIDQIQRELGRVDILVNNAARMGFGGGDYWGSTPDNIDAYYQTNLRAPYFLTLLVAPIMEAQGGGAVFNITSGGANLPAPPKADFKLSAGRTYVGYGITKAAMNRWVTGVAGELLLHKVAIVAVDPGRTVVERNLVTPVPGVDYSDANTPETSGRAIAFMAQDPMSFTGKVVVSKEIVDQNKLEMTGRMPSLE